MRSIVAIAAALVMMIAPGAVAQQVHRGGATQSILRFCVASPEMRNVSTPEPSCACAAGILSGQMTDNQYIIAGRLTPFSGNQDGMVAEIQRIVSEGYPIDDVRRVGELMIAAEPLINSTCGALER
jgi:hypothetical protein